METTDVEELTANNSWREQWKRHRQPGNIQNKNNHNVVYILSSIANEVLGNAPTNARRDEVDAVQPDGTADTRVIGHKPTPQGNRKPPVLLRPIYFLYSLEVTVEQKEERRGRGRKER